MKKVQRVFTGNHTQKTSLAEQQETYRSQIRVERQAGTKTEHTLDGERAVLNSVGNRETLVVWSKERTLHDRNLLQEDSESFVQNKLK